MANSSNDDKTQSLNNFEKMELLDLKNKEWYYL
jgi:hypothetical protein